MLCGWMAMFRSLLMALALTAALPAQTEPCPADAILDLSAAPGPGTGYAEPRVEAACDGDQLVIRSNGIPHYEFVQVTPNPLLEQDYEFRLPATPRRAENPIPIPLLGSIGVAVNGVVIYGPNEGPVPVEEQFGDPIFNAIMDACMGHTALEYHYHALVQKCLDRDWTPGKPSPVLGFGFDGFPIMGPWGCADAECFDVIRYRSSWESRREPHQDAWDAYDFVPKTGAEYLDACNGHVGPSGDYHYHATESWPYVLGCYAGAPVGRPGRGRRGPRVSGSGPGPRPPAGGPQGRPGRRGGPPPPGGARPDPSEVAAAASALSIDEVTVAKALRVDPGNLKPVNLSASARTLGIGPPELIEALGRRQPPRRQRRNQAPPGEPECFFRCGQSDEDAVGCTLTDEHKVLCFRPCDDNKCG